MTRKEIIQGLKGIFPPVVTPFNQRGEIEEGLFRENLQKLSGIGLAGVLVAGSSGEAPYLTEAELWCNRPKFYLRAWVSRVPMRRSGSGRKLLRAALTPSW